MRMRRGEGGVGSRRTGRTGRLETNAREQIPPRGPPPEPGPLAAAARSRRAARRSIAETPRGLSDGFVFSGAWLVSFLCLCPLDPFIAEFSCVVCSDSAVAELCNKVGGVEQQYQVTIVEMRIFVFIREGVGENGRDSPKCRQ